MHDGRCAATNDSHPNEPDEGNGNISVETECESTPVSGWSGTAHAGYAEQGGSASGFDGFEEIMESYLLRGRCEAHARDPDAHMTQDTVVCLGLHVDEEAMSRPARICGG